MLALPLLVLLLPRISLAGESYNLYVGAGSPSGGLYPNPVAIGSSALATLTASADAPTSNVEGKLMGPIWSWSVNSVYYRATPTSAWKVAAKGGCSVSVTQPDTSSPAGVLQGSFSAAGYWYITLKAVCTYTDEHQDVWSGSGFVSVTEMVAAGDSCGQCSAGGYVLGTRGIRTAIDGNTPDGERQKLADFKALLSSLKSLNSLLDKGDQAAEAAKSLTEHDLEQVLKEVGEDQIKDRLKSTLDDLTGGNLPPTDLHEALNQMIDAAQGAVDNLVRAMKDRLFDEWVTQLRLPTDDGRGKKGLRRPAAFSPDARTLPD